MDDNQWNHPQLKRVVKGWKAACGYANVDDRLLSMPHQQYWNQGIESDSIIGELKKIKSSRRS